MKKIYSVTLAMTLAILIAFPAISIANSEATIELSYSDLVKLNELYLKKVDHYRIQFYEKTTEGNFGAFLFEFVTSENDKIFLKNLPVRNYFVNVATEDANWRSTPLAKSGVPFDVTESGNNFLVIKLELTQLIFQSNIPASGDFTEGGYYQMISSTGFYISDAIYSNGYLNFTVNTQLPYQEKFYIKVVDDKGNIISGQYQYSINDCIGGGEINLTRVYENEEDTSLKMTLAVYDSVWKGVNDHSQYFYSKQPNYYKVTLKQGVTYVFETSYPTNGKPGTMTEIEIFKDNISLGSSSNQQYFTPSETGDYNIAIYGHSDYWYFVKFTELSAQ